MSGIWDVEVSFLSGARKHRMCLDQNGGLVTGSQKSHQFEGEVTGSVDSRDIHLVFTTWHEGTEIIYSLDGSIAKEEMHGVAVFGSAPLHHKGPLNAAQFGPGRFKGLRRGAV